MPEAVSLESQGGEKTEWQEMWEARRQPGSEGSGLVRWGVGVGSSRKTLRDVS